MSIIHFSTVFKVLDVFVEKHNAASDSLSNRLRQPVIATAREVIRIYGASLFKVCKESFFDTSNIPPLKTNNVQLAKISHVSTRTIKRHLIKLIKADIITRKICHGRYKNYELFLNPKILLINCEKAVDKRAIQENNAKSKRTDNQFFKKEYLTTCPPSDTSNNSYINNILIAVDNKLNTQNQRSSLSLTNFNFSGNKTGNNFTGYVEEEGVIQMTESPTQNAPGEQNFHQKESENHQKHNYNQCDDVEEEAVISEVKTQAKDTDSRLEASGIPFLISYVEKLWKFARQTIYKDQFLNKYQITTAKELLLDWYTPVKDRHLEKVHQVYIARLKLVKKYLDKDREKRFVQLPDRYFDTKNPFGFTGTKRWYENQKRSQKVTRAKLITHAQIRRFVSNEQKRTSNQKPRLPLFHDCEKKVQRFQNPKLLDQFYKRVLEYTS